MGQYEVYEAIRALGGRATAKQVAEYLERSTKTGADAEVGIEAEVKTKTKAKTKALVNKSLVHLYIARLCHWNIVSKEPAPGMRCGLWVYRIAAEYPERNVVTNATSSSATSSTATAATPPIHAATTPILRQQQLQPQRRQLPPRQRQLQLAAITSTEATQAA
jgi:hypothetical protein